MNMKIILDECWKINRVKTSVCFIFKGIDFSKMIVTIFLLLLYIIIYLLSFAHTHVIPNLFD